MKIKRKNIIVGYRQMLGYNQKEFAELLGISKNSYYLKENGKVSFNDKEKMIFKNKVSNIFPEITIDDIFFN